MRGIETKSIEYLGFTVRDFTNGFEVFHFFITNSLFHKPGPDQKSQKMPYSFQKYQK